MLAFQTVEYYNKSLDLLKKLDNIFSFLKENIPQEQKKYILGCILEARKNDDSSDYIYRVSKQKCENGEFLKHYQDCFSKFNNDFCFFEFYKLVSELELEYHKICEEYHYTDTSINDFISNLNNLSKLHETLIRGSNKNVDKVNFFEEAEKIVREYYFIIKSISCYISSITNNEIVEYENGITSLNIQLLNINFDVREFYEILGNIDEAYSTLGMIITENKSPLKINKIESGSLLADIFGNEIIIGISIYLLKRIIDIVYNKYSDSGKVDLIGKEIKTIAESAETLQKLDELGIKVNKTNKKMIGECLTAAINKLHKVVVKSPKIKINGEMYSVADAQKYLEYSQKLLEVEVIEKNKEDEN